MSGQLTATRYTDWSAVAALAPAWARLRQSQPDATVFAGYGFARALWKSFGARAPLDLVAIFRDGDIVGLAVFTRRTVGRAGLRYREAGFFRNHHTLRNAILVAPNDPAAILSGLFGTMAGAGNWEVMFLENLPSRSFAGGELAAAAAEHGLHCDKLDPGRRLCFVRIEGSWDDYRATLSANMRWQLKKFRRRAEDLGRVEFRCLSTRNEIAGALPEAFVLETKSWQGRERADEAATAADHAFERALVEDLEDDEIGDLWLMTIDGRTVASLRMLGEAGKRYVHTMHYDPAAKEVSPGSLLFEKMLETAWAQRLNEVDFHGDSAFFRRWTSEHREHVTTRVYCASLYGRLLQIGRRLKHSSWRAEPR